MVFTKNAEYFSAREFFDFPCGKRGVTHKSREEPLAGIGCFPVSSCVQVVCEILELLLIPMRLFQALSNLLPVFLGDVPQDRPSSADGAHTADRRSACQENTSCFPDRQDALRKEACAAVVLLPQEAVEEGKGLDLRRACRGCGGLWLRRDGPARRL